MVHKEDSKYTLLAKNASGWAYVLVSGRTYVLIKPPYERFYDVVEEDVNRSIASGDFYPLRSDEDRTFEDLNSLYQFLRNHLPEVTGESISAARGFLKQLPESWISTYIHTIDDQYKGNLRDVEQLKKHIELIYSLTVVQENDKLKRQLDEILRTIEKRNSISEKDPFGPRDRRPPEPQSKTVITPVKMPRLFPKSSHG